MSDLYTFVFVSLFSTFFFFFAFFLMAVLSSSPPYSFVCRQGKFESFNIGHGERVRMGVPVVSRILGGGSLNVACVSSFLWPLQIVFLFFFYIFS